MDVEAIEAVEAELDKVVERRAREFEDAERVSEMWAESVRVHHARRRETNRAAWRQRHPEEDRRRSQGQPKKGGSS